MIIIIYICILKVYNFIKCVIHLNIKRPIPLIDLFTDPKTSLVFDVVTLTTVLVVSNAFGTKSKTVSTTKL